MTAGMITQMQPLLWILQKRCAMKPIKGAMSWEGFVSFSAPLMYPQDSCMNSVALP
jgi:hypothetical protein